MTQDNVSALPPGGPLVIPIVLDAKRPLIKGWRDAAKPLEAWRAIRDWEFWPRWAALCGAANGFWVLDVDGEAGRETLRQLMEAYRQVERYGPLSLYTVMTPKGMHIYFKWGPSCEGLTNTAGKLGLGLDVRTEGGYVLCPPTEGYQQVLTGPMLEAPAWLLGLLQPKAAPHPPGGPAAPIRNVKAYADWAVTTALREINEAKPGTRNATLNRNAFGLGRIAEQCNLDVEKLLELLVDAAINTEMPAYEALDTVQRALEAGVASVGVTQ
jgi:hypothetical protein